MRDPFPVIPTDNPTIEAPSTVFGRQRVSGCEKTKFPAPRNLTSWFRQNPDGVIFFEHVYSGDFRHLIAGHELKDSLSARTAFYYPEEDHDYYDTEGNTISYTEFWSRTSVAIEERLLAPWLHINKNGDVPEVITQTPRIFVFRLEAGLPGYLSWFTEF